MSSGNMHLLEKILNLMINDVIVGQFHNSMKKKTTTFIVLNNDYVVAGLLLITI